MNLRNIILSQIVFLGLFCGLGFASEQCSTNANGFYDLDGHYAECDVVLCDDSTDCSSQASANNYTIYSSYSALASLCGVTGGNGYASYIGSSGNYDYRLYRICGSELNCEEQRQQKEFECGGAEYLESWDDDSCTGECYCDEPGEVTYPALRDFCGGDSKVEAYDQASCEGTCDDCNDDYLELEQVCAGQGLFVDEGYDWDTCDGSCTEDCSVAYNAKEQECAPYGVVNWDDKYCVGDCRADCSEEYNALEESCGIVGVATFDQASCTGTCNTCEAKQNDCEKNCGGAQNVNNYSCRQLTNSSNIITGFDESECECGSPNDVLGKGSEGSSLSQGGFGQSGDFGGTVVTNPDGTKTETMSNGSTITYSSDGNTIFAKKSDGVTVKKTNLGDLDGNGSNYYEITTADANGNYLTEKHLFIDGQDYIVSSSSGHSTPPENYNDMAPKTVTQTTTTTDSNASTPRKDVSGNEITNGTKGAKGAKGSSPAPLVWEKPSETYAEFVVDPTLLAGELERLNINVASFKEDISNATGVDLQDSERLPSFTIPSVGDFPSVKIDLKDFDFVFDMIASVVPFIAYFIAILIIFG